MFCPNCGTENEQGALFCANCGTSLAVDEAPQTEAPQTEAPVTQEPTVQQETVNPQAAPQMQGQPVYYQPQAGAEGQPVQPNKANGGKAPFKVTKQLIIIAASVAAVLVALIVFICVGKSLTNYKKAASQYVTAVEQCQFDKAYSLINLPDSEFLTKEAFIAAHADATGEKVGSVKVMDSYSAVGNMPGNKAVKVMYTTASGMETEDLVLTVSNKHYMLFFKKYKVSSDGIVASNCTIRAPKGVQLSINGKVVGDQYLTENSKNSGTTYNEYKIPYLFRGDNDIKVTSDFTEEYTTQFYVSRDEDSMTVSTSNVKYTDAKLNALKDQAKQDLESILSSAQAKKDFSSINDKLTGSNKSTMESNYKNLTSDFNSTSKIVSDFKLTNFTGSISDTSLRVDSEDGCPTIKVSMKLNYSYKYKYSSSDKVYDKTNSSSSSYFYYKYEDGKWKISSMYISLYL